MGRRRLDPAAAQQRLSLAIAPDEVVASVRVSAGQALSRPAQLTTTTIVTAAVAAIEWAISPRPGLTWGFVLIPVLFHFVGMSIPRRYRFKGDYILAVTRERLLIGDYPAGSAPVRVIFASPVSALRLELRHRGQLTQITGTAADGGQLVWFGRRRRRFVLLVRGDQAGQHVLEAFLSRGGIGPAAASVPIALS
jgi:hypothetical protein